MAVKKIVRDEYDAVIRIATFEDDNLPEKNYIAVVERLSTDDDPEAGTLGWTKPAETIEEAESFAERMIQEYRDLGILP